MGFAPRAGRALLLGVDLGGSGFRVSRVEVLSEEPLEVAAAGVPIERAWPASGFVPVALDLQLADLKRGDLRPLPREEREGRGRAALVAAAMAEAAQEAPRPLLAVGICAPGLRSPDERGIAATRNGPRAPELLARIEEGLARLAPALAGRLAPIASDGLANAVGEWAGRGGALAGVRSAYALAGGSGLAEAFVIDGQPRALDRYAAEKVEPAWRMQSGEGASFEDLLAPARLNRRWAERSGLALPLAPDDMPEVCAARGEARAKDLILDLVRALAELIARRADQFCLLSKQRLERVVLGRALASVFGGRAGAPLRGALTAALAERARAASMLGSRPQRSKDEVAEGLERLPRSMSVEALPTLVVSGLPAAPLLGAAALAFRPLQRSSTVP